MSLKSRKLFVWLISLALVLAVYLLYSRLTETPKIDFRTPAEFSDDVSDSNVGELGGKVGMVGDVGIGPAEKARFITLNDDTKEIEREVGFEQLLHKQGDEWEVEKPYMNVFQPDFKCRLTADKGWVQVETAVGKTSPKDATFTGNVVVHILPENGSDIKESFTYLDNLVFISEKSQLSTAGPVEFVSEDTQMLGKGLELVYNSELHQLEFLRIIHLERLSSKVGSLSSRTQADDTSVATRSPAQKDRPAESVAPAGAQKQKVSPTAGKQLPQQKEGQYYKCQFSKNVVIDTPEQLIFGGDVFVNDIFWPKHSAKKSDKANDRSTDMVKLSPNAAKEDTTSMQPRPDAADADKVTAADVPVATPPQPGQASEQMVDVVITCENGILVTPMDSPRKLEGSARPGTETTMTDGKAPKGFDDANGRPAFIAHRIDYSASTEDVVASGPSELAFEANDPMGTEPNGPDVPVKITARKKATFLPASSQVIFEGDCVGTMLRDDPNARKKYTLSGQKLTIDLPQDEDGDKQPSDWAGGIQHLTATGGVVRLATVKTAAQKFLGGIELKCASFDFDAARQQFLATGPGMIAVDNSKISQPNSNLPGFSLKKPCWAFVRHFETLTYSVEANQIIADARSQRMLIDYIPVVQGKYGLPVWATAAHIVANLIETADGQSELSTLTASGGITYEDGQKQFAGSRLFYDADESKVTVRGDESWPCLFNGALVDGIEYDLITGKINFKVVAPGVLQMKR